MVQNKNTGKRGRRQLYFNRNLRQAVSGQLKELNFDRINGIDRIGVAI
jgi:hypothetical protein